MNVDELVSTLRFDELRLIASISDDEMNQLETCSTNVLRVKFESDGEHVFPSVQRTSIGCFDVG